MIPERDSDRPASPQPGVETAMLAPGAAIVELTQRPRLLGWTDPVGRAREFANLARLVRTVPVFMARVPWGPPFAPGMIGELLAAAGAPFTGKRMPAS